jgi:hypothetical protein
MTPVKFSVLLASYEPQPWCAKTVLAIAQVATSTRHSQRQVDFDLIVAPLLFIGISP